MKIPLFPLALYSVATITAGTVLIGSKKVIWKGKEVIFQTDEVQNAHKRRLTKVGGYTLQVLGGTLGAISCLSLGLAAGVSGAVTGLFISALIDKPTIYLLPPSLFLSPILGLICAVAMIVFCAISLSKAFTSLELKA